MGDIFATSSGAGIYASSTIVSTGNLLTYGNLGVSTSSPSTKLSVNGPAFFDSKLIRFATTTTGKPLISISTQNHGQLLLPVGSPSAPSLSFAGDPDTGIYQPNPNLISFSINGTARLHVTGSYTQSLGTSFILGSTEPLIFSDTYLQRDGAADILALKNSTATQEFRIYNTDSTDDEFASLGFKNNSNVFGIETEETVSGTRRDIALLGGNVGIGTTSPWGVFSVDQASTTAYNKPVFVVGDNGTTTPFFFITQKGVVGFGTSSPSKIG